MSGDRDWQYEYDGAAPPLPEEIRRRVKGAGRRWIEKLQTLLPRGCHFLRIEPRIAEDDELKLPGVLAGVLRIHHRKSGWWTWGRRSLYISGSGDLYILPRHLAETVETQLGTACGSNATDGPHPLRLLQFKADDYRYYLRLKSWWLTSGDELLLEFDTFRFDAGRRTWEPSQSLTLRRPKSPDDKHPVFNQNETEVASFRLRYVTEELRHAEVHFHALDGLAVPNDVKRWRDALQPAGWQVYLKPTHKRIVEIPEYGWSPTSLNEYHRKHIEASPASDRKAPHSQPWIYHLMVVDTIKSNDSLGYMFDFGSTPEDPARQGGAIAAEETIGGTNPVQLKESTDHFSWVALHEMGHMQGLYHNPDHPGIMQPWRYRVGQFTPARDLRHSDLDLHRLRHLPDLWVRPGGVPYGHRYRPIAVDLWELLEETEGLRSEVGPLVVPAGGRPESLHLTLYNDSGRLVSVPSPKMVFTGSHVVAAFVRTPSGSLVILSPPAVPARLGIGQKRLLPKTKPVSYQIRWPRNAGPLRQVGLYELSVYLTWIIEGVGDKSVVHHVRVASAPLWVVSREPQVPGYKQFAETPELDA